MIESYLLAQELDRVVRKLDAHMHRHMPKVDVGRVGPMGGFLLLYLEALEPCAIQALADATGRDNSQLTRLIRSLEMKGLITRRPDPTAGRVARLELTYDGREFLLKSKAMLTAVVEEVAAPLDARERQAFFEILSKL